MQLMGRLTTPSFTIPATNLTQDGKGVQVPPPIMGPWADIFIKEKTVQDDSAKNLFHKHKQGVLSREELGEGVMAEDSASPRPSVLKESIIWLQLAVL